MAREYPRKLRIEELLQRELSTMVLREIKDPRVQRVTITRVDVSPDLSHAKVLMTVLGADEPQPDVVEALSHASGFLRHSLGKRLRLRSVPELRFIYDESLDRAAHLEALIARANQPPSGHE